MRARKNPSATTSPDDIKRAVQVAREKETTQQNKKGEGVTQKPAAQPAPATAKTKSNPRGAGRKPKFDEPLKNKPFLLPLSWHTEIDAAAVKYFAGNVSEFGRAALREYLNKLNKIK